MARGEKIWVVRAGDGTTVGEIVARALKDSPEAAFREGRVFIGKKRTTRASDPVKVGDSVRIGATAIKPSIEILWMKDDLVACIKPAGLPTVPDHQGASHSLVALVEEQSKKKLLVTSRLDREVSGVVIFAASKDAEQRLLDARKEGHYARRYIAIGALPPNALEKSEGTWGTPIDEKESATRYRRIAEASSFVMLACDPVTGRTHQIRIHASRAGAPLIGDREYGGSTRIVLPNGKVLAPSRVALHAARVVVPSIRNKDELLEAKAPMPQELVDLWAGLGGEPEAWNRALQ
jgi:23S rRNA-/tRNA-specific pseudouridylate synthase